MTEVGFLLFAFWLILTFVTYVLVDDIAAPPMFVLAATGVFFSDLYFNNYPLEVYLTFVGLVILPAVFGLTYRTIGRRSSFKRTLTPFKLDVNRYVVAAIWVASLPAVIGQLYFIQMFGGLEGYLTAAKWGTKHFQGLGFLKVLALTYYPISLLYFAILINRKRDRIFKISFLLHFLLFIIISMLTLSRGALLTHLVAMLLIFHFSYKQLSALRVASILAILLVAASIYGVLRETVTYDEAGLNFNWGNKCSTCEVDSTNKLYRSEWMFAGTFPLERVYNSDQISKKWGATYLTIITNFVPRSIWPEKPPPGGVVFTNEYASEFYDQYSHFATGLIPEAVINFGHSGGVLIGFSQLIVALFALVVYHRRYYYKAQRTYSSIYEIRNLVIFVLSVHALGISLVAEVTSLFMSLIIKTVVIVFLSKIIALANNQRG